MKLVKKIGRSTLEKLSAYHPRYSRVRKFELLERREPPKPVTPQLRHLQAAIQWLKQAQDATTSGGVAWGYRARRPIRTALPLGWIDAYPETTGYIIPTLLRYADIHRDEDSARRARRMAVWELDIQLKDGGIQGGFCGQQPVVSSSFVTGQVLFGLVAAYEKFGEQCFLSGAERCGEFLLASLGDDGSFVRGHSHFCAPGAKTYEARTGLAMAELADCTGDKRFRDAAWRIADYTLRMQRGNGWFDNADLNYHDRPLTHTIAYILEGLHGLRIRLQRNDCLHAVQRTLDCLLPLVREDGFLAGRWRDDWTPAVNWACLTGSSQIAGMFLRVYQQTRNPEYLRAGERLLGFVCFTQDLRVGFAALDGGIHGSYPFGSEYGQWSVLNWATKFFCDSVMEYLQIEKQKQMRADEQGILR